MSVWLEQQWWEESLLQKSAILVGNITKEREKSWGRSFPGFGSTAASRYEQVHCYWRVTNFALFTEIIGGMW